ncbi:hypothetical protein HYY72_03055 [Candidatus Woesearchaeota archaeon]|nr:hypothetical protein [Candidatus Woesearchaeota archaeon]
MFIRTKKIKGKDYGYLVNNSWTEKGARQKVACYLGKVHKPERIRNKTLKEFLAVENLAEYFDSKEYKEIIGSLIRLELHNHNVDDFFFVDGNMVKTLSGKEALIQANQGFICSGTLKQLHEYNGENDDGYALASLVTAAGLNVEKDIFVLLFEKAKSSANSATGGQQSKEEFYY